MSNEERDAAWEAWLNDSERGNVLRGRRGKLYWRPAMNPKFLVEANSAEELAEMVVRLESKLSTCQEQLARLSWAAFPNDEVMTNLQLGDRVQELQAKLDRLYSLLRKANKGMLAGEGISLAHYMRYPAEVGEPVTEEEEAELEAILVALK